MRVKIIRHGKVNMPFQKRYTAEEYGRLWDEYDQQDILPVTERCDIYPGGTVYVTGFKRTHQTAEQYLGTTEYTVLEGMMDEVPLVPFWNLNLPLRKRIFDVLGRLQWYWPFSRQPEHRHDTYARCDALINYLEKNDQDCVLVLHGFFMHALIGAFRKHGYKLDRKRVVIRNLCTVEAVKDLDGNDYSERKSG